MDFPNDQITGIPRARFYAAPPDFPAVTDSWEYADGGRDFNEVSDTPPRRWEYFYTGLSPAQAFQFDEFANTVRRSVPFDFTDPYGVTWTNVFIEDYKRYHDAHKSWIVTVEFYLVGYGSEYTDEGDPIVDITVPAPGASLSGTVILRASAFDSIAVDRVEFYAPVGIYLGADSSAPYTYSLDTTLLSNGPLTIEAIAFDETGNQSATASVGVTVAN